MANPQGAASIWVQLGSVLGVIRLWRNNLPQMEPKDRVLQSIAAMPWVLQSIAAMPWVLQSIPAMPWAEAFSGPGNSHETRSQPLTLRGPAQTYPRVHDLVRPRASLSVFASIGDGGQIPILSLSFLDIWYRAIFSSSSSSRNSSNSGASNSRGQQQ